MMLICLFNMVYNTAQGLLLLLLLLTYAVTIHAQRIVTIANK